MYQQKKVSLIMMCEPIEVQLLRFNAYRYNLLRFNSQMVGVYNTEFDTRLTDCRNGALVCRLGFGALSPQGDQVGDRAPCTHIDLRLSTT